MARKTVFNTLNTLGAHLLPYSCGAAGELWECLLVPSQIQGRSIFLPLGCLGLIALTRLVAGGRGWMVPVRPGEISNALVELCCMILARLVVVTD